ncbi:MAG: YceI family protein [Arachnia sp.]
MSETINTSVPLTGVWTLDPTHSRIGFVARHAMVTKVRGSFNDFNGIVTVDDEKLAAARIELVIQAASIDTRNEQRDEHLRTNDFFDMETYPEISFVSSSIDMTDDENLTVVGDLSVKSVTKEVSIPFEFAGTATDPFGNVRAGFDGSLSISRSDFGVTWNAALETGGVLVSDKITLEFEISAIKTA